MPLLPLPVGETSLAGGDLPVTEPADVLAEFPRPHRNPQSAPVRDAFAAGWDAGLRAYQNIAARAAAQSDPMRATGEYQRSFAEERGIIPRANESEESVRARLFQATDIVTPNAIRKVINDLLADYTDKECAVHELDLDGWFVHDSTASEWDSFVGVEPDYPDRYYADRPWLEPPGAIPAWGNKRTFTMRIPPLEENDATVSYLLDDADGIFVGDGTNASGSEADGSVAFSVFVNPQTADDLYRMVVGAVETIKGQGMPWSLIVDPSL